MRALVLLAAALSVCAHSYGQQAQAAPPASVRERAEQGEASAQSRLGFMYANGDGVPQDYAEAAKWYRKAADQGEVSAQYFLGSLYNFGNGVPQDYTEAVKWFRKAADQGLGAAQGAAQFALGLKYEHGYQGVPKDYFEAVKWLRKASDQGFRNAQHELGVMYEQGDQGVSPNLDEAAKWYRKAAADGDAEAQNRLDAMNAKRAKRLVPMLQEGAVYRVPVLINNTIALNFIVDSGAADVSIPSDVVTTLMRTGAITRSDFIGTQTYTLADGSTTTSRTFRIRSLKVGDTVLQDVVGSVANREGELLLGQSFLGRFKSWSIDNTTHTLVE